jgi:glycerol-3-phosphate acyltransferase PlsY
MISGASISWPNVLLCLALGYLLGSIPFGVIITRLSGLGDVRKIGSGSIGATNVLRTGNKWAAALTLLLDGGKGFAAVLIGYATFGINGGAVAGIAVVFGHIFPVWLRFNGGKGVATFIGVMLAVCWPAGLLVIATWLIVAYFSKISSLSALIAAVLAPAYTIAFGSFPYALLAFILAVVIFFTHHENIHRLWRGEEPRIGSRKSGD